MAQGTTDIQQTIDRWLEYLTEAWQGLPQAAADIDHWDLIEQIDYVEEWSPKVDLTSQLRRLIASSDATPEQRARYERLQRLMSENRPILERLRAS